MIFTLGYQGAAFIQTVRRIENQTHFISAFGPDDSSTFLLPKGIDFDGINNYQIICKTNSDALRLAEVDSLGNLQNYRSLNVGAGALTVGEIDSTDSKNTFVPGSVGGSAFLQKINPSESVEWSVTLSDTINTALVQEFVGVDSNTSGESFVLGKAENINRVHTGSSKYTEDLIVVKYDANGASLWQKSIAAGSDASTGNELSFIPFNIKIDNSGGIILLGITADWDGSNLTYDGRNLVLVRLNSDGSPDWQQELTQQYRDFTQTDGGLNIESIKSTASLTVDGFNNIYLSYTTTTGDELNGFEIFPVIIKYSSSGTLLWQKSVTVAGKIIISKDITSSLSGDVYFLLQNLTDSRNSIVKLLSNGTVSWERDLYLDSANLYFLLVRIALDRFNNVLAAGSIISSSEERQGVVVKIPNDGSKIGTDTFKGNSFTYSVASLGISSPIYNDFSPSYIVSDVTLDETSITSTVSEEPTATEKTVI